MKNKIHIVGDLHGKIIPYKKITRKYPYTVCVGDVHFKYGFLKDIDPTRHVINSGNHDCIEELSKYPHWLGHSGMFRLNEVDFFFIRGAYSVDKEYRTEWVDWWRDEELNHIQAQTCVEQYYSAKPDIVISHDCPTSILKEMFDYDTIIKTFTGQLLDVLFEIHRPKIQIFGHHHISVNKIINGTNFICLNELEVMELI